MSIRSSSGISRSYGSASLEDDVERRLGDIKYKLVHEKLDAEKEKAGRIRYHDVTGKDIYGSKADIDTRLHLARLRHEDLKHQVERERVLAEKLAERPAIPPQTNQGRVRVIPNNQEFQMANHDRRSDRMSELMEMMMLQNNQVLNMILNQTLLKTATEPRQSVQQVAPQTIPYPVMYPPQFPMYPAATGYHAQAPVVSPRTPHPRTPKVKTPVEKPKRHKINENPFPFPGNYSQQKLRRLAYAAFFLATLNRLTNENKFRPTQEFLFDLKLKEIIESLHRIYKAPEGQLYNITISSIMGLEADELTELLNVPKTLSRADERAVSQELSYALENTVFHITDIMPATGILGTHRKSGLFEMLRSGNRYPDGYFYNFEYGMLEFDEQGAVQQITDNDGMMLLIGIFVIRALVETLYLKTQHYGMVPETTPKADRNIKLMASILMYLYRKIVGYLEALNQGKKKGKASMPELPGGLREVMYSDQEIRPILKLIKKSFDYSEKLLIQWGEEYILRLRAAAF